MCVHCACVHKYNGFMILLRLYLFVFVIDANFNFYDRLGVTGLNLYVLCIAVICYIY